MDGEVELFCAAAKTDACLVTLTLDVAIVVLLCCALTSLSCRCDAGHLQDLPLKLTLASLLLHSMLPSLCFCAVLSVASVMLGISRICC